MTEPTREPEVISEVRLLLAKHPQRPDGDVLSFIRLGELRAILAAYDAIVAELDAAVRQCRIWEEEADYAMKAHANEIRRRGEAEAKLAAAEAVVNAADAFCSYQGTASEGENYAALNAALDAYLAAVAAETQGCTVCGGVIAKIGGTRCEAHIIITGPSSAETQGETLPKLRDLFGKHPNATLGEDDPTPHAGGTDA